MHNRLIFSLLLVFTITYSSVGQHDHHDHNDHTHEHDSAFDNSGFHKARIDINENRIKEMFRKRKERVTLPYLGGEKDFKAEEFKFYDGDVNPVPGLQTFALESLDDKSLLSRVVIGPAGINITHLKNGRMSKVYYEYEALGKVYYEEWGFDKATYLSGACEYEDGKHGHINSHIHIDSVQTQIDQLEPVMARNFGNHTRIYRVAIVCTAEYQNKHGGNSNSAKQRAIENLTDVSFVYETQINVKLIQAQGSPRSDYSNPGTDPFDGPSPPDANTEVRRRYPNGNRYDIGHSLHSMTSGYSGVAWLSVLCDPDRKGGGWTGHSNNPSISMTHVMAHEFGHQMGSPHTYNGDGGNCAGNQWPENNAYEIGSGISLMSYNGLCGDEWNIGANTILGDEESIYDYLHVSTLQRITDHMDSDVAKECNIDGWEMNTNNIPVANANPCGAVYVIPRNTKFYLRGEGTDADPDDYMTYSWEQYDRAGRAEHGYIGNDAANSTVGPLFRCYPPNANTLRHFPKLSTQVGVSTFRDVYEVLPRRARNINMRFVVRDNHPSGSAVDWDQITIKVVNSNFSILGPTMDDTFTPGGDVRIEWETQTSDDLCEVVDLRLSIDGGESYPITLQSGVSFSKGFQTVTLPANLPMNSKLRFQVVSGDYTCFGFYDNTEFNGSLTAATCTTPESGICNEAPLVVDYRASELNFGKLGAIGTPTHYYAGGIDGSAPTMSLAVFDSQSTGCVTSGTGQYHLLQLTPTKSGLYRFEFSNVDDDTDQLVDLFSIFRKDSFDPQSPCSSFVSSNGKRTGSEYFMRVDLEACTDYYLAAMLTNTTARTIRIFAIEGSGNVLVSERLAPSANLAYVAVSVVDKKIKFQNSTADFTSIDPGSYNIYSVAYETGNPSSWIGKSLNSLTYSDDCLTISDNYKPVEIISSCAILDLQTSLNTSCNSTNNKYSLNVAFSVDNGPTSGTATINGQDFNLTSGINNVVLTNLDADGKPLDLNFTFSSDSGCQKTEYGVFTAPENCCQIRLDLGDQDNCIGEPAFLDAGNDGRTYEWFFGSDKLSVSSNTYQASDPGIYTVVVTDIRGCQKSDVTSVSFSAPPTANIIDEDFIGCEGDSERLNTNVANYDSLAWLIDGFPVEEFINDRSVSATTSGLYELRVFNGGCIRSDFVNMTFKETTPFELGEDIIQCSGLSVPIESDNPDLVYEWQKLFSPDPPLSSTTYQANVTESGTYQASGTNQNGCVFTDNIRVRFENLDKADVELGDPQSGCSDKLISLRARVSPINWYYNDQLIVGYNFSTLNRDIKTGTYIAEQYVSDECFVRDTVEVEVFPSPEINLGPNMSFCEGSEIDTILRAGEDFEFEYRWKLEGNDVGRLVDGSLPVTEPGNYRVVVTDKSSRCWTSAGVSVELVDNPTIELESAPSSICDGGFGTIRTMASTEGIAWYLDGVLTTLSGSVVEISKPGTYRGVIAEGQDCSVEIEVVVDPLPVPVVDLPPFITGCEGIPVEINAGPQNLEYIWFYNGVEFIAGEGVNSVVRDSVGEYVVIVFNGICTTRDTTVLTFLDASFVTLPDDATFCRGNTETLIASTNAPELTWYNGTDKLSETGTTLDITDGGTYIAVAQEGADCEARDTMIVMFSDIPTVAIDDVSVCEGEPAFFDAGLDGAYIYSWLIDDVPYNNSGGTLTLQSTDLTTLTAEVKVSAKNLTDDCFTTVTANLEFKMGSTVSLSATGPFCAGIPATITATSNENRLVWYYEGTLLPDTGKEIEVLRDGEYLAVAGSGDCSQRDSINIQFNDNPDILIKDQAICTGEQATFIAGQDGAYTYEWYFNNALQANTLGSYMPSGAGIVRVIATNLGDECFTESEAELEFVTMPTLNIFPFRDQDRVCYGSEARIRTAANPRVVRWIYDGQELDQTGSDAYVTEPGTYTAIVGNGDCEVSDEITIEFLDSPDITLADQTKCQSETATFVAGADGVYLYEWTLDGVVQSNTSGSFSVTSEDVLANRGEVSVTAKFINDDCEITLTAEAIFIDSPIVTIDPVSAFCMGDDAVITTNTNVTSLTWFRGTVELDETGTSLPVTEAGTYRAVAGSGNCADEDMITVSFVESPDVTLTAVSTCQGEDAVFVAGADDDYDYEWFVDDQPITNSAGTLTLQAGDISGTTAIVRVTATNKTDDCSSSSETTVEFITAPVLDFLPLEDFCTGSSGVIRTNVQNIMSLIWYKDNTLLDETGLELEVTEGGVYRAEAGTGPCAVNESITVEFADAPDVQLLSESICQGDEAVFVAGNEDEYNYEWFLNDNAISNTSGTLRLLEADVPTNPASVKVIATNKNNDCFTESEATVEFIMSPSLMIITTNEFCTGNNAVIRTETANVTTLTWYRNNELLPDDGLELEVTEAGIYRAEAGTGVCAVKDSIEVEFVDAPVIMIEDETRCSGDEIIMVAGDNDSYTYEWYIDDVIQSNSEGTFTISEDMLNEFTSNSTFGTIKVIAKNLNDDCTTEVTAKAEFLDASTLEILPLPDFCTGDEARIFAIASDDIQWFINGELQDETSPTFRATESGEYLVISGTGPCAVRDSFVVVFSDPPPELISDVSVCADQDAIFVAGDDDEYRYAWALNGRPQPNDTLGTFIVTSDDVNNNRGVVSLSLMNINDNCRTLQQVDLEFLDSPELNIQDPDAFCDGQTGALIATTNANALEWTLDGVLISATTPELEVTEGGTYRAKAGEGDCAVLDSVVVVFDEAPVIELENIEKCAGEDAVFVAGADGAYTYLWKIDGVDQANTSGTLVVSDTDIMGNSAMIEVNASLGMSTCTTELTATVSFIQNPELIINPVIPVCSGGEIEITTTTDASSLTWSFEGEELNENGISITVTEAGLYMAQAGDGDCAVTASVEVAFAEAPVISLDGETEGCGLDPITLTLESDTNVPVVWSKDASVISGEEELTLIVNDAGTYTAMVTNAAGCESTEELTISYYDFATLEIQDLPDGVCEGVAFEVEAVSDGVRFEWLDANGAVIGTQLSQDFDASGSYSFVAYNEADCPTSEDFELEFRPAPIVDLGADQKFCIGESVDLSVPNQQNVSYEWTKDGTPIGSNTNTLTVDESGLYILEATNDIDCITTDEVTIEVVDLPTISAETEVSFCTGGSVSLEVNTNATLITWMLGNQEIDKNVTSIDVTTAGTYTVIAATPEGCRSEETIVVSEVSVQEINFTDIELCPGDDPIDLTISGDFDTYEWTGGISGTGATISIPYKTVSTETTEVILVTADKGGCAAMTSFNVTYYAPVALTVENSEYEICAGESIGFEVSGGSNYSWDDPSGTLSNTAIANPTATPTMTTTYEVTVGDVCPNNFETATISVTVNPLPIADAGSDRNTIPSESIELEATGGTIYEWNNEAFILGSANIANPEVMIDAPVTFTVTVTDDFGCAAVDSVLIGIVNDPSQVISVIEAFSPNGDEKNDFLQFDGLDLFPENRLTIFNRWGNIVYEKRNYQNDDERWDGTRNDELLPADTYYYILEFSDFKVKNSLTIIRD